MFLFLKSSLTDWGFKKNLQSELLFLNAESFNTAPRLSTVDSSPIYCSVFFHQTLVLQSVFFT